MNPRQSLFKRYLSFGLIGCIDLFWSILHFFTIWFILHDFFSLILDFLFLQRIFLKVRHDDRRGQRRTQINVHLMCSFQWAIVSIHTQMLIFNWMKVQFCWTQCLETYTVIQILVYRSQMMISHRINFIDSVVGIIIHWSLILYGRDSFNLTTSVAQGRSLSIQWRIIKRNAISYWIYSVILLLTSWVLTITLPRICNHISSNMHFIFELWSKWFAICNYSCSISILVSIISKILDILIINLFLIIVFNPDRVTSIEANTRNLSNTATYMLRVSF